MLSLRNRVCKVFVGRQLHGNSELIENCKEIRNRNPRNLERLRIARKPIGFIMDQQNFSYWHKLAVNKTQRFIVGEIIHFENGPVISASTYEWGLRKSLYSPKDGMAYKALGKVLAQRCLECGICEIYLDESLLSGERIKLLVEEMEKGGIVLQEPKPYKHWYEWDPYREEKPWESFE